MADDAVAAWFTAVEQELGLDSGADNLGPSVDELVQTVRDEVDPAAAAQTAFLVGIAAGRAADASVAGHDFSGKIAALARGWSADASRGEPANDQSRRA
jgi:Domain of unknown function (DUF6457)